VQELNYGHGALLRTHRDRPCSDRATEQADELGSLHAPHEDSSCWPSSPVRPTKSDNTVRRCRRLLHCRIAIRPNSAQGQTRPWRHVRVESVLPPTSDIGRRHRQLSACHNRTHALKRALLQDLELMPQYQDFRFQPPSRLEAVAQHADEQQAIAIIRRSCSDSLLTASDMD
jgi:hypothetical protein